LEVEPWLDVLGQFHFEAAYAYSRYNKVQGAHPGLKHPSNDQLLAFDLGVVPWPNWDADIDMEFAQTPRLAWGFRSVGGQVRYQWLDDIIGDPVSLTTGLNLRYASWRALSDVSCPYHSTWNAEFNASVGKEWEQMAYWVTRVFAFGGVGIANHGSPWLRGIAAVQANQKDKHQYTVFAAGYFGFGRRQDIDIRHFHGYGSIHHQSVDLGIGYRYSFGIWGSLSLEYAYRVYAHAFPAHVNWFAISYRLPFSFF
jgi:hypothetical protein